MEEKYEFLAEKAKRIRRNIVYSTGEAGSGHPGGSLSATDILTALYFAHMRHDPKNHRWPERDRFVLSKGHCAPALYATLAEAGYFDADMLAGLRKLGSPLQGHPSTNYGLPGVEASTGSLGQGLSIGVGMALSARLDAADWRVYVMLGDGECEEGMVWEAAMSAAHYRLSNLVAIVDRNGLQIDGATKDVMNLEPFAEKWKGFGWQVQEIDGHEFHQILRALQSASRYTAPGWEHGPIAPVQGADAAGPQVIIAHTIKGKGVSFMENSVKWHGQAAQGEELECALRELKC
ncbi:MAG: transketolase [Chloroflexi bacterium]|nr:transketolase [Chloroflexota bacterium]